MIFIIEALSGRQERLGAGFGWEVAHLTLDGARVVSASAAVRRPERDLDQKGLLHVGAVVRGEKRHKMEGCAGRSRSCA